jgi:hypothetical protein
MLKAHEVPTTELAALTAEMNKPRIAAALALNAYECSGCGCRFPETRAPKGTRGNTAVGKDSCTKRVRSTRLREAGLVSNSKLYHLFGQSLRRSRARRRHNESERFQP